MYIHGEISKFFPPTLLEYLASFGKDGMLTIRDPEPLLIAIKGGCVVDAHSPQGDAKLLRVLYARRFIDKEQYHSVTKSRAETKLSVREILNKMNIFPMASIQVELMMNIEEVIFQFFQLKQGSFVFNESIVVPDDAGTKASPDGLLLYELTSRLVDWEENQKFLGALSQFVTLTEEGGAAEPANRNEELIHRMINGERSIDQIVNQAPVPRVFALRVIANGVHKGWFTLEQRESGGKSGATKPIQAKPNLFLDFKRCFREILQSTTLQQKVEHTLQFCRAYFDLTLILSVKGGRLTRCLAIQRDASGRSVSEVISQQPSIGDDQVVRTACEKGMAFFGRVYPSNFFDSLVTLPKEGECGLIPISVSDDSAKLIFAVTHQGANGLGPLHFLDLLSWLIAPSQMAKSAEEQPMEMPDDIGENKAAKLIALHEELPAMPHVVGQALNLIADPDSSLEDITKVLSQDLSLLALIIKVSNSALYNTGVEITNLQTAVTKLGLNIVRSLVLVAFTHAVFPWKDPRIGRFGKAIWQHATECGVAARTVAQRIGYADPEEAFVGGLLHDIGRLVILMGYPEEYGEIERLNATNQQPLLQAEKGLLGFDHTLVGQMLIQKWQLPAALQACVEQHHCPHETSDKFRRLVCIITLADHLSNQVGLSPKVEATEAGHGIPQVLEALGLDEAALDELKQQMQEAFRQPDLIALA